MAIYTPSASDRAVHEKKLVATTVDTVTFPRDCVSVEVISDGTAALYLTVDGSTPTVAGPNAYVLPAGAMCIRDIPVPSIDASTVVKLVSAGTPTYSVTGF